MYDFFPELHLPNGMTSSPHPDHSTGPKPIQLAQVVFTIEWMRLHHCTIWLSIALFGGVVKIGTPASLSENAMKKDEGGLFQPFHHYINRSALRCGDLETSADLLALIVFELQHFP